MRYKLKKIILRVIPLFVSLVLIFGLTFQSPRDTVKLSESSRKCIVTFLKAWDIDVDNEW